jgi:hypothetical protein
VPLEVLEEDGAGLAVGLKDEEGVIVGVDVDVFVVPGGLKTAYAAKPIIIIAMPIANHCLRLDFFFGIILLGFVLLGVMALKSSPFNIRFSFFLTS